MSSQPLEEFLKCVKASPELRQRCSECHSLDEVAALGHSNGFEFSGIDVVKHQAEATLRLSDQDLAPIAAGVELQGHLWLMRIVWG